MSEHPSFFELDLVPHAAASEGVAAHVAECDRCRAHVDAVRGRAEAELPAWVDSPPAVARLPRSSPRSRTIGAAGAALATAAAVLLFMRARTEPAESPYVGEKGTAAVQVLVQRGTTTTAWDGRALRPGDRLGLMATCAGRRHVTLGATVDGAVRVLADAPCQAGAFQLPVSVVLDDRGTEDELLFGFGDAAASGETLHERRGKPGDGRALEVLAIRIPKEPAK
jgi:hypothetical protein